MDNLPPELLRTILLSTVHLCRSDKNDILPLRLVNKRFDFILREYIFKTVQLDFSRLAKGEKAPRMASLASVSHLCQALYCDMMVIRDEEEIARLYQVFNSIIGKVPEMTVLLKSLRQYCMSDTTFDETDFRRVMDGVLQATPNLTRLKLNLPFQVIGRASRTATLLLATTFACFASRPTAYRPLETLVLDHVSDSTLLDICQNPMDVRNALCTFKYLKNLVISIKRQESTPPLMGLFASRLWRLISEADHLESLCVTGWNVKSTGQRWYGTRADFNDWMMKSLPYPGLEEKQTLKYLRYLELKRVDIDPNGLALLVEQNSTSLKELYLNEVYLKVVETSSHGMSALWIGKGDVMRRPAECCWLAERLREMESLNLDVLRVSDLGYNEFDPSRENETAAYDFTDPSGLDRPFEERFVEAVLGQIPPPLNLATAVGEANSTALGNLESISPQQRNLDGERTMSAVGSVAPSDEPILDQNCSSAVTPHLQQRRLQKLDYDAESYQRIHNTTSHWKCSIDGFFYNHNKIALEELQRIIKVADRGMTLLSDEIDRLHSITRFPGEAGGDNM